MRSSKSRSRNKSNRQRSIGNIINRVFDSSGPEGKVRGTPQQIIEKYLALARDAQLSNDRVAEQNFLQHAEHYTRMLGEAQRELAREQEERNRNYQQNSGQNGQSNGNGQNGGQNGNGNGNGNGYRERAEREPREPQPEAARFEEAPQPRYDGAPVMMPDFFATAEDDGPGLVETPEMRQPEPPRAEKRVHAPRPVEAAPAAAETEAPAAEAAPAPAPTKAAKSAPAGDGAPKPRSRAPRKPRTEKPKAEAPPEGSAAE